MIKVGILGCGRLGRVIAERIRAGKAPGCEVVGVFGRTPEKAQALAADFDCTACTTLEELLALKPAYILEAATAAAVKEHAVACLQAGVSFISLSTGALNDGDFYQAAEAAAREGGAKFYAAPGVIGGLDLAATALVAGEVKGTLTKIHTTPSRIGLPETFSGTTREAYEMCPAHLNIAVTAGLACGGLDDARMLLEPKKPGELDGIRLELEGDFGTAYVECRRGGTPGIPAMAAWSAVAVLKRVTSPIEF